MKICGLLVVATLMAALPVGGALGAAFTYQGSLNKAGEPVSAAQDFEFGLYGSAAGDDQVGTTVSLAGVAVTEGLFSVDLDFGAGAFGGAQRFLQIDVRPAGAGDYTGLWPRAAVMPAPAASSVGPDGVNTAAVQDGSITREKLAPSVNPKLLLSLPGDYPLPIGVAFTIPFVQEQPSDGLVYSGNSVLVETPGTYVVSCRLKMENQIGPQPFTAQLILNGSPFLTITDTILPIGTTTYSGFEIVQLEAGDIMSTNFFLAFGGIGLTVKGGPDHPTNWNIVRID